MKPTFAELIASLEKRSYSKMLNRSDAMERIQGFLEANLGTFTMHYNGTDWAVDLTWGQKVPDSAWGVDESLTVAIEKCLTEAGVQVNS